MTITVVMEMQIKKDLLSGFIRDLNSSRPDTLAFDGCVGIDVLQDDADPNHILMIERWTSAERFAAYGTWRESRGDSGRFADYFQDVPQMIKCNDVLAVPDKPASTR